MTTAPPAPTTPKSSRPRRPWTRMETPEAALLVVALLVLDGIAAVVMGIVIGDAACRSGACQTNGVSVGRPVAGLLIALAVIVVPLLVAWFRRRGMKTTLVVQLVIGAMLVTWAATSVSTALAVRSNPPAVPAQPKLRPCAAKTLEGVTCLTYSTTAPPGQ